MTTANKKVTTNARERKARHVKTDDLVNTILGRIAEGESLNSICSEPGMPTRKSFFEWIDKDDSIREKYDTAIKMRAEAMFDEIDDVSDKAVKAESQVEVAGLRLKADNIKWKLARMAPKKYGDKVQVGGADDLPPIRQDVSISPEDAYKRMLSGVRD